MEDLLVPLLIFGAPERHRAEITEQLLPAAVPGTVGQRLAFAAVVAQQQISNREQTEIGMVKEAAARFIDAKDLADSAPTLARVYTALPDDVRATIEFNTIKVGYPVDRSKTKEDAAQTAGRKS